MEDPRVHDAQSISAVLTDVDGTLVTKDKVLTQLQNEGAKSFVKSWNELLAVITSKTAALPLTT